MRSHLGYSRDRKPGETSGITPSQPPFPGGNPLLSFASPPSSCKWYPGSSVAAQNKRTGSEGQTCKPVGESLRLLLLLLLLFSSLSSSSGLEFNLSVCLSALLDPRGEATLKGTRVPGTVGVWSHASWALVGAAHVAAHCYSGTLQFKTKKHKNNTCCTTRLHSLNTMP